MQIKMNKYCCRIENTASNYYFLFTLMPDEFGIQMVKSTLFGGWSGIWVAVLGDHR